MFANIFPSEYLKCSPYIFKFCILCIFSCLLHNPNESTLTCCPQWDSRWHFWHWITHWHISLDLEDGEQCMKTATGGKLFNLGFLPLYNLVTGKNRKWGQADDEFLLVLKDWLRNFTLATSNIHSQYSTRLLVDKEEIPVIWNLTNYGRTWGAVGEVYP